MYPSVNSVQKTTVFVTKLNELFEDVGFDSEFARVFEIKPFKVAFIVVFPLLSIFQSIPILNGLSKSIALVLI